MAANAGVEGRRSAGVRRNPVARERSSRRRVVAAAAAVVVVVVVSFDRVGGRRGLGVEVHGVIRVGEEAICFFFFLVYLERKEKFLGKRECCSFCVMHGDGDEWDSCHVSYHLIKIYSLWMRKGIVRL